MLTAELLEAGGTEIPAVDKNDVKRLWLRFKKEEATTGAPGQQDEGGIAYDTHVQEEGVPSSSADPLAVYARVTILTYLEVNNLLDQWRTRGEIEDVVYQSAATYPLPKGMQSFVPEDFIAKVKNPR